MLKMEMLLLGGSCSDASVMNTTTDKSRVNENDVLSPDTTGNKKTKKWLKLSMITGKIIFKNRKRDSHLIVNENSILSCVVLVAVK